MRRIAIFLAAALALTQALVIIACASKPKTPGETEETTPLNTTHPPAVYEDSGGTLRANPESAAFMLVEDMKAGWNLGNALDCLDNQKRGIDSQLQTATAEVYYETLWGNPVTTPGIIAGVAEMGFGAVRVPVTWQDHMDENYEISQTWLERVGEVVNCVIDNGMYCIINLHHDTGTGAWPWLRAEPEKIGEYMKNLRTVWTQIAVCFQDYDERLLFESFNEILDTEDRWTGSTAACYDAVNQLNQTFVDTVRATGGCNDRRFLIVSPYAAGADSEILSYFRIPADTIEDHLIVSVHTYAPAGFTWHENMAGRINVYSGWDDDPSGYEIREALRSLRENIVDKGVPVIISECGAWNKSNSPDRCAYAAFLVREAAKERITCFWWDAGGEFDTPESVDNSSLYDRYNEAWFFPEVARAFTQAASARG